MFAQTKHLNLRAFDETTDTDTVIGLIKDQRVEPWISNDYLVPQKPKIKEALLKSIDDVFFFAIITVRSTEDFVGFCQLALKNPKNRDAEFGIALHPDHWSRGYGTEVMKWLVGYGFNSLALHRISLDVYQGNERAISLYKQMGFVDEGTARKSNWVNGEWHDMYRMGILEEEWKKLR